MSDLTHIDKSGKSVMVDVGGKSETERVAKVRAVVFVGRDVMTKVDEGNNPKGNVIEVARVAGVMGAKKTSELIPYCHPIALDQVSIIIESDETHFHIEATASCRGKTGVEMEAFTGASVAALTLIDMLKALSKEIRIESISLIMKSGGKSGHYVAEGE